MGQEIQWGQLRQGLLKCVHGGRVFRVSLFKHI